MNIQNVLWSCGGALGDLGECWACRTAGEGWWERKRVVNDPAQAVCSACQVLCVGRVCWAMAEPPALLAVQTEWSVVSL